MRGICRNCGRIIRYQEDRSSDFGDEVGQWVHEDDGFYYCAPVTYASPIPQDGFTVQAREMIAKAQQLGEELRQLDGDAPRSTPDFTPLVVESLAATLRKHACVCSQHQAHARCTEHCPCSRA